MDFYLQFQQRFRGSEAEVAEKQRAHLPVAMSVADLLAGLPLIDLGPGRGEWLELWQENGIAPAYGLEKSVVMAEHCRGKGLDVRVEDINEHLSKLEENSVAMITAFHLIEHLPPEYLIEMIGAAHRVLSPGGVLLLETPNPKNLQVAAHLFWTDPTHIKPVPQHTLQFLAEYAGFAQIEIKELHPMNDEISRDYADEDFIRRLNQLLFGPQDYALIATK